VVEEGVAVVGDAFVRLGDLGTVCRDFHCHHHGIQRVDPFYQPAAIKIYVNVKIFENESCLTFYLCELLSPLLLRPVIIIHGIVVRN
jgi:hypothetical protein